MLALLECNEGCTTSFALFLYMCVLLVGGCTAFLAIYLHVCGAANRERHVRSVPAHQRASDHPRGPRARLQ